MRVEAAERHRAPCFYMKHLGESLRVISGDDDFSVRHLVEDALAHQQVFRQLGVRQRAERIELRFELIFLVVAASDYDPARADIQSQRQGICPVRCCSSFRLLDCAPQQNRRHHQDGGRYGCHNVLDPPPVEQILGGDCSHPLAEKAEAFHRVRLRSCPARDAAEVWAEYEISEFLPLTHGFLAAPSAGPWIAPVPGKDCRSCFRPRCSRSGPRRWQRPLAVWISANCGKRPTAWPFHRCWPGYAPCTRRSRRRVPPESGGSTRSWTLRTPAVFSTGFPRSRSARAAAALRPGGYP